MSLNKNLTPQTKNTLKIILKINNSNAKENTPQQLNAKKQTQTRTQRKNKARRTPGRNPTPHRSPTSPTELLPLKPKRKASQHVNLLSILTRELTIYR